MLLLPPTERSHTLLRCRRRQKRRVAAASAVVLKARGCNFILLENLHLRSNLICTHILSLTQRGLHGHTSVALESRLRYVLRLSEQCPHLLLALHAGTADAAAQQQRQQPQPAPGLGLSHEYD